MYENQINKIESLIGVKASARIIVVADWITERLGEESTWRGMAGILTAMGVIIDRDRSELIIACGMLTIGCINFFKHDEVKSVKNRIRELQDQLEREQASYKRAVSNRKKRSPRKPAIK